MSSPEPIGAVAPLGAQAVGLTALVIALPAPSISSASPTWSVGTLPRRHTDAQTRAASGL